MKPHTQVLYSPLQMKIISWGITHANPSISSPNFIVSLQLGLRILEAGFTGATKSGSTELSGVYGIIRLHMQRPFLTAYISL